VQTGWCLLSSRSSLTDTDSCHTPLLLLLLVVVLMLVILRHIRHFTSLSQRNPDDITLPLSARLTCSYITHPISSHRI